MQDWNFTVSWVDGQEVHLQVPDMLSRLVSNPEETETSIYAETAVLVVAVAQVDISDAEYAIISSQHNAKRGHSGVDDCVMKVLPFRISNWTYAHSFENIHFVN